MHAFTDTILRGGLNIITDKTLWRLPFLTYSKNVRLRPLSGHGAHILLIITQAA